VTDPADPVPARAAPSPLLRSESGRARAVGVAVLAAVGAGAAALVALGNPPHMGVCGACFLRDLAGALRLSASGPAVLRPEVAGVVLGATLLALACGRFVARSGSHAASRFLLGVAMAMAALVFLGCPFRTLQRLGGGDWNAWVAIPGFFAGVGLGVLLERRGYSVGKTTPAPAAVGLLAPLAVAALLAAWLLGAGVAGPGPAATAGGPARAPWPASLGVALAIGALLSLTGFCAVSAARSAFGGRKAMLLAALALVLGYAAVSLATGRFTGSFTAPLAHSDAVWNVLALALLGLSGALAGGCPVRQMVMAGEGNADAFVTVAGLVVGGALAHGWGVVSSAAGPTDAGRAAVVLGLVAAAGYGVALARARPGA
jgi:YedE family putative selenium metabolism protein